MTIEEKEVIMHALSYHAVRSARALMRGNEQASREESDMFHGIMNVAIKLGVVKNAYKGKEIMETAYEIVRLSEEKATA